MASNHSEGSSAPSSPLYSECLDHADDLTYSDSDSACHQPLPPLCDAKMRCLRRRAPTRPKGSRIVVGMNVTAYGLRRFARLNGEEGIVIAVREDNKFVVNFPQFKVVMTLKGEDLEESEGGLLDDSILLELLVS